VEPFHPEHYFDLSSFAHKELFANCEFVWQALEKIETYLARKMLGKIDSAKQEYAYFVNPESISIGEGTIVEPGAYIKGPCIIGKHCHIRHGAYIRGNVIIGDHCVVGHATELKHAILLNHAHAAHFAYVGDSIIGNHVNLGAGTKCANLRLNGDAIIVHHGQESISTGLRKFGAIVGDHCQIGCNVVLNPGATLGKHVQSYPSLNFGGVIPEKSLVRPQTKVLITPQKI
jgi:UDP-N-acetylglucosamine diphosphorylase / glucose-1-phosphate thymidylyltransferase / UDP-N-acetylgalactosamine diphosphorylase / glucosamine-1-phosphate N-acetyltransferase / galactosamine-1-phosphate N-acetyltransferase